MTRLLSGLVVVTFLAACGMPTPEDPVATTTAALTRCPPNVPAALAPAPDQALWRVFPAEGAQIYVCTATGWVFESPDALLFKAAERDDDADRVIVGHHYAGPTWEYKDGSSVVGTRVASAASPLAGAIPWLLLTASAHGGSPGRFTEVTTVQRLETFGGVAPTTACESTTLGARARVPYTANYYMYRAVSGAARSHCR